VLLDGNPLHAHAPSRARMATVCADEPLLPAKSVRAALALALRARADSRSADSVLDEAGLGWIAPRKPRNVAPYEARAIAAAFALSHAQPAALVLHEPLSLLGVLNETWLLSAIERAVTAGAVVLCTATRLEDAARLGGQPSAVERGVWLDAAALSLSLTPVTLRVHTPEPRRLVARLSETPDIAAVEWAGGSEVLVRGSDFEQLSLRVVSNARAEAIRITALRQDASPLELLGATRAGLAQAYYERAYGWRAQ
jgi:hypothetical protein